MLTISDPVFSLLIGQRQLETDASESGGILLGRLYESEVVLEQISLPGPSDKRGRFFFERDVKRAQCIVNDAWQKSNGKLVYIGEWHTHPETIPTPSSTDKQLIRNMLRDTKMEINFLFLTIVGTSDFFVGLQKGAKLIKLMASNLDIPDIELNGEHESLSNDLK